MQRMQYLALPAYAVACVLIVFPLVDTVLSIWPPRMSDVAWRFGAAGLFSRALMTPLLALLLALATALLLEHRRVLQLLLGLSVLAFVLLLGASGLFILDAVQMRSQVAAQSQTAFDIATVTALGKYGAVMLVLIAFGLAARRAGRGGRSDRSRSPERAVVVRPRSTPASAPTPRDRPAAPQPETNP